MSAQALLSALTTPTPGGGVFASVDKGEAGSAFSALLATETTAPAEAAPTKRARPAAPAPTPEPVEVTPETPAATAPIVVPFTIVAPVSAALAPSAAASASGEAFGSNPAPSQGTTKDTAASSPTDAAPAPADPSTDVAAQGIAVSSSNAALAQTAVIPAAAADGAREAEGPARPTANTILAAAQGPAPAPAASVEVTSSLTAPPPAEPEARVETNLPATTAAVVQGTSVATSTPPSGLPIPPEAIAEPSSHAPTTNPVGTASAPGSKDAVSAQPRLVSASSTPATSAKDGTAPIRDAKAQSSDAPTSPVQAATDAVAPAQPSIAKAAVSAWISPAPRDAVSNPAALRATKAASALVAFDVAAEPLTPSSTEGKADAPARSARAVATPAPTSLAPPTAQIDPDLPTAPVTPSPRDIIEKATIDAGTRSTQPSAQDTTAASTSAAAPSPSPTAQTQPVLADAAAQPAALAVETAATLPVEPLPAEPVDAALPGSATAAPAEARAAAAPHIGLGSLSRATIETTAQLAAQITRRLEGRSTRFEMALTPDGLGRVDVSLDIDADGQLAARLAFDNPLAATDLRGRADELRRQLEDAGLTLARDALEFSQRDGSSGGQNAFDRHQNRATAYATRAAAEAVEAPIAAWINPSPTPRGVDLKV